MTNPIRLELNKARADYNRQREHLGRLNKVIGTKRLSNINVELSGEVLAQLKRDKSRVFGDMNKARARLKRAMVACKMYLDACEPRRPRGCYIGLSRNQEEERIFC